MVLADEVRSIGKYLVPSKLTSGDLESDVEYVVSLALRRFFEQDWITSTCLETRLGFSAVVDALLPGTFCGFEVDSFRDGFDGRSSLWLVELDIALEVDSLCGRTELQLVAESTEVREVSEFGLESGELGSEIIGCLRVKRVSPPSSSGGHLYNGP